MNVFRWAMLFSFSVGFFGPAITSADGFNPTVYQAFDHHLPDDRMLFNTINSLGEDLGTASTQKASEQSSAVQTQEDSLDLKSIRKVVRSAYKAKCHALKDDLERESCDDLVKVMLLPGEALKTSFGRKMHRIFVDGDFSSPEGKAVAMALCIDSASLSVVFDFDAMKSGGHDRSLLPWFRFYAKWPQLLMHTPFLFQLLPEPMILALNKEIEESWQSLAYDYHRLAHGQVAYPEYFKSYRRHFQAIHARETLNRALTKVKVDTARMSYLAIYNRGLFGVSQAYSHALKSKSFEDVSWVRDWLNAPYRVVSFHKDLREGNVELEGAALEALKRFQLNERNNLLSFWNDSHLGAYALLVLYEEGFSYLPASSAERERYRQEAKKIRETHHWGTQSIAELGAVVAKS